jgi:cell wall-associated NlpC family hydrolase
LYIFIITGCSQTVPQKESIYDLSHIPQDVSVYSQGIDKEKISSLEKYQKYYFKPWNVKKINISLDEAMWAYKIFTPKNSYGANLQPLNQSFFDKITENSNFVNYSTVNKKAITLKQLNIRAFPTDDVVLRDPNKAGEGFPFDYMQNSSVGANKPILISHYSKDEKWAFIQSSFAYGWVKSKDIVLISQQHADAWQAAKQVFFTQDHSPVTDQNKAFLFQSQIGVMLPLINDNNKSITVLSIDRYKGDEAYFRQSTLPKEMSHENILDFNAKNINKIINELSTNIYGWGGMYCQRDCSSTLRDFFAPFGIWLPRNSFMQGKVGKVISFKNMTDEEKIETIKKDAIPFETLLYKRGHIVLYVGTYDDKIVVFHNTWGIKTNKDGKEGRFIIGKPIFSTLTVGKHLKYYDDEESILTQLKSMNIVTQ